MTEIFGGKSLNLLVDKALVLVMLMVPAMKMDLSYILGKHEHAHSLYYDCSNKSCCSN